MGLPDIRITFQTKGLSAIQRSERGIVAGEIKEIATQIMDLSGAINTKGTVVKQLKN